MNGGMTPPSAAGSPGMSFGAPLGHGVPTNPRFIHLTRAGDAPRGAARLQRNEYT
jgi:hypothetical protein